ncbi:MAG: sigma 54-interacting transcriptional regulator [Candidatus Sumerlaeaceae bacterium]|nr:sigma 54-interacting transcriptional regulator [Candidatus Sumerlaeaceae bacterium]
MPKFVVRTGPQTGTEIEMRGERLLFGRSEECDVVLADPNVSRNHAQVLELNGMVLLYDLNSSNGTFVNDIPISRTFLMDGDEIRIGNTVFKFVAGGSVATSSAAPAAEQTITIASPGTVGTELAALDNNTRLLRIEAGGAEESTLKDVYLKLKTLYRISVELFQSTTLDEMLDAIARAAQLAAGIERFLCYLPDEGAESWNLHYSHLSTKAKSCQATLPPIPLSFIASAAEREEALAGRWNHAKELEIGVEPYTIVAFAVKRNKQPVAVVCVDNPVSADPVTKDDIDFLATLTRQLLVRLRQVEQVDALRQENLVLRQRSGEDFAIVTQDDCMKAVMDLTMRAAERDCPVLILGETGTGKELVARSLHNFSRRRAKPFVAVNCAALPDTLLESELFGHEKGAFTGALERRIGKFELADGGTLFLDEIGDMSPTAQAKLLRVLQDGEIQRLGGNKIIRVNVRVVAATNKKLEQEVEKGNFRQDLYYRIRVLEIILPPLRERPADIPVLAKYFLDQLRHRFPTPVRAIHPDTMRVLLGYHYPGNVRELKNIIERALVLASGEFLLPEHLPREVLESAVSADRQEPYAVHPLPQPLSGPQQESSLRSLAEVEREHIMRVLKACGGSKVQAATVLGISRTTLYEKLKEYGEEGKAQHDANT